MNARARWWSVRHVRSSKPSTYRCPFCSGLLHAMSDHVLIAPEGDTGRRRHAHTKCVAEAREAGRLPSYDEWRQTADPHAPGAAWRRVARALTGRRYRPGE